MSCIKIELMDSVDPKMREAGHSFSQDILNNMV